MNGAVSNTNLELILVVALIAGISAVAWLLMANPLRLYRTASLRFALANVLIVIVVVVGASRETPDSVQTLLSVSLVVAALSVYDLAVRRLFRMDDSYTLHGVALAVIGLAFGLWLTGAMSVFLLSAGLYALGAVILARTCIKKVRLLGVYTSPLAAWLLSVPDFLVTSMLLLKATFLLTSPQQMWAFLQHEGDNTLAIWIYIVMTLGINATAFASSLARIILRMKYLATHDQLTGLFNRRAVTEKLHQYWTQYQLDATPFSVLMLDVDHFKRINDHFGHQAGDQALRYLADTLVANTQREQLVARFGGEEFIIVLPGKDMRQACDLANQLCRIIRAEAWHSDADPISVSVGCGAAMQADSLDQMLSQADHALYDAKRSGRAQVKTFYASSSLASSG